MGRTSKMVFDRTRVLGMTSSHPPVAFFLHAERKQVQMTLTKTICPGQSRPVSWRLVVLL